MLTQGSAVREGDMRSAFKGDELALLTQPPRTRCRTRTSGHPTNKCHSFAGHELFRKLVGKVTVCRPPSPSFACNEAKSAPT